MDRETLTLLGDMVRNWASDHHSQLKQLEQQPHNASAYESLFNDLQALGLLDLLGESLSHNDLEAVAEIAYQMAHFSPSVALMVVQQNLAAWLLTEFGQPAANGWVALPLFDGSSEWQHQSLALQSGKKRLKGHWLGIPLLPIAQQLLLPLATAKADEFRLVRLSLSLPIASATLSEPIVTLGLRGCPQGDLECDNISLTKSTVLQEGAAAWQTLCNLWSQAEVCMMALRAGIANASYQTALDYAKERYQGGKIIINHSLIRKMLSDFYRDASQLNDMWRRFAQAMPINEPLQAGQMGAALQSGERVPWLTSDGIQILGGVGYMEDYPQESRYRDAKQCEFLLGHPQARQFAMWQTTL